MIGIKLISLVLLVFGKEFMKFMMIIVLVREEKVCISCY